MTRPGQTCPVHGAILYSQDTKYGMRYACAVEGCTVVGWDGPTSTAADDETRTERIIAHAAFDSLWRGSEKIMKRSEAYWRLSVSLGLPPHKTHIGMFDRETCALVVAFVKEEKDEPQHEE